jgi:hypothetical protein
VKLSGVQIAGAAAAAFLAAAGGLAYVFTRREPTMGNEIFEDWDGYARGAIAAVATAAGQPLDRYCLARAIASEEGGQPRTFQVAVGCAILNFARSEFPQLADGDAVIALVTGDEGAFGRQGTGGRRVASTREPARLQFGIAEDILAGKVADMTAGSTQFDSPEGQRAMLARGDGLTRLTPEQVADNRYRSGYELVVVPGIDPDKLRFWRQA